MKVAANYFMRPAFRIRRTSIKVSAVVTEITEPNKIIRIPALSIPSSSPSNVSFFGD